MYGELDSGKIAKHGINGKISNVIINMYNEIKLCVNGYRSGVFSCEKSVRQGEKISHLLFAVFLNDLDTFQTDNGCHNVDININEENFFVFVTSFVYCF